MSWSKSRSRGVKVDRSKTATTRTLTRILAYLTICKESHMSNISIYLNVSRDQIKDALLWLVNHNLLIVKKKIKKHCARWGSIKFYSLSKDKKLKGGKKKWKTKK